MQSLNKKAMSQVVTTLLIISVGIVAVGIVATVILNVVDENKEVDLSPEAICLNPEIEIQSACYNIENQELEITLKRTFPQRKINKIIFDLISTTKAESYSCSPECGDCSVLDSGIKTYYLEAEKPDSVNLKINNCFEKKIVGNC